MNINKLKTGQRVSVVPSWSDKWMEGVITKVESVTDKFVQLDNGEEVFDFEIEKCRIIKQ